MSTYMYMYQYTCTHVLLKEGKAKENIEGRQPNLTKISAWCFSEIRTHGLQLVLIYAHEHVLLFNSIPICTTFLARMFQLYMHSYLHVSHSTVVLCI